MIECRDLYFAYPNGPLVLKGINLRIEDGEFVAIMGENGAGKTTLIKMFNGLLKPTKGDVLVDGVNTRSSSVAALSRSVGIVFQNPDHQLFSETVKEEVAFALRNFGYPDPIIEERVNKILRTLDIDKYADTSPFMLSGGERKRVALASVLAWDPKHLVLDEPTIGQDYQQKERLKHMIMQLNSQGKTVVVVTHDVEFMAECKPRIILLSKGELIADGLAEAILTDEEAISRASLVMPQIARLAKALSDLNPPKGMIEVYSAYRWLKGLLGGGHAVVG